ncbi:MAG: PDZ domain-containing protein [Syntrophomonadaceae bacterium]|nr:PDZ domain-containing protein [Syntrophomonadaceae bacterium]
MLDLILPVLTLMGHVFWNAFTSPSFLIIYCLLFLITNQQYKRLEDMSARARRYHPLHFKATLISIVLGLLGGILGSLLIIIVGIDISRVNILPLWVLALILMMISPRFLCFAYAGGVLAVISLVSGYPQMDIAQLLALVAVLHMVESLLILLNGHLSPVPVYVQRDNEIIGGFNLQKFWPIPLLALASTGLLADPGALPPMPSWWPLLKSYSSALPGQNYILLPLLAVLGYGEITTTAAPGHRVRKSSANLLLFSIILLILSIASSYYPQMLWAAALFAPLGHETVIWLGTRQERSQLPLYVTGGPGLMMLDVVVGSPAYQAGLRSADRILSINGQEIATYHELLGLTGQGTGHFAVEVSRDNSVYHTTIKRAPAADWGITPVPEAGAIQCLIQHDVSVFSWLKHLQRIFRR